MCLSRLTTQTCSCHVSYVAIHQYLRSYYTQLALRNPHPSVLSHFSRHFSIFFFFVYFFPDYLHFFFFFFFNDPAPPEFSPLPLPDALPISVVCPLARHSVRNWAVDPPCAFPHFPFRSRRHDHRPHRADPALLPPHDGTASQQRADAARRRL